MTLVDLVVNRCIAVLETSRVNTSKSILVSRLADAILEIQGMRERVIKIFITENYVQVHLEHHMLFLGIVENNVFGLTWEN